MYSASIGLRKQTDDKKYVSQLTTATIITKLEGFYNPDWNDFFVEARYYSSTDLRIRYTYVFDQQINNADGNLQILENGYIIVMDRYLTVGISLGSLY